MVNTNRLSPLIAMAAVCLSCSAGAHQATVKFSGFGTVGLTHSNSNSTDYKGTFFDTPTGPGYSESWSLAPDTRIAGQMDVEYGPNWELTGQVMTRKKYDKTFEPSVETFNLKYKFDKFTYLRAGRFAHPYFMVSDARLIGYAVPFARGPVEVYGGSNIHTDGVQFAHRMPFRDSSLTTSFGLGEGRYKRAPSAPTVAESDPGKFKQLIFGDVQYEIGSLTLRVGVTTGKNDYASGKTKALYDMAYAADPALGHELDFMNKRVAFYGLGATWDDGDYFAQFEYTMTRWGLKKKSIVPADDAYYLMLGKHIGSFSPYAIFAQKASASPRVVTEFTGLSGPTLNNIFTAVAKGVPPDQHTWSVGLRWDFKDNMAMKVQFDRTTIDSVGNTSYFIVKDTVNAPKKGDSINVIGINLDFVF